MSQDVVNSSSGFSLVEIMIAVMILGLGLVMVAGAFPVGIRAHEQSMDETIAALLAQSAVAAVKMYRTPDAERAFTDSQDWTYFSNSKGQIAICECFSAAAGVHYLFDAGVAGHSGGLVADMLGGSDINDWLTESDRVYRPDPRYAYQVFYQRIAEPDADGPPDSDARTFEMIVLVQKSQIGTTGSFAERFGAPSGRLTVSAINGSERTVDLPTATPAPAGAALVDLTTGDVYKVIDAVVSDGTQRVTVERAPSGDLAGHEVRIVRNVVGVFVSVVSKTLPG